MRNRVWESLWQPLEVLRAHQEQTPEKLSELVVVMKMVVLVVMMTPVSKYVLEQLTQK